MCQIVSSYIKCSDKNMQEARKRMMEVGPSLDGTIREGFLEGVTSKELGPHRERGDQPQRLARHRVEKQRTGQVRKYMRDFGSTA